MLTCEPYKDAGCSGPSPLSEFPFADTLADCGPASR